MNLGDIDLDALLRRLRLPTVRRLLTDLEPRAAAEGWSHRDFVAVLIAEEVAHRNGTRVSKAVRNARCPFVRTIEDFDFVFQSTLRKQALGPFLGPELVSEGRNLVLSGKPGRGKTHIAIAVAYRAIQNGYNARFVSAADLIDTLSAAAKDGRLREATAEFVAPAVLVVDEVGYLHHANDAANVLFGVVDQRYLRKRPIILTTNKRLKDWGQVLHDSDLAEVILDRILERGTHIALGGPSWRRKHLPETEDVDLLSAPNGATLFRQPRSTSRRRGCGLVGNAPRSPSRCGRCGRAAKPRIAKRPSTSSMTAASPWPAARGRGTVPPSRPGRVSGSERPTVLAPTTQGAHDVPSN